MVLQVVEDTMHIGAETAVTLKAQVNLGWTLASVILFNIPICGYECAQALCLHKFSLLCISFLIQYGDGGYQCRLSN
jgi:hypothetical protein